MSKPTAVILLCEDTLTSQFVRRLLERHGIRHGLRVKVATTGSAYDWVIQQYPDQVNAYRLQKARTNACLIVVVDADAGTLERRMEQLDASLRGCGNDRVRGLEVENERIARLIPRRNIETWILVLSGSDANEVDDYKRTKRKDEWLSLVDDAASELFKWTRPNAHVPNRCIDSIRHGFKELRRLDLSRN